MSGQPLVHAGEPGDHLGAAVQFRPARAGPRDRPTGADRDQRRTRRTSTCRTPTCTTIDSIDRGSPWRQGSPSLVVDRGDVRQQRLALIRLLEPGTAKRLVEEIAQRLDPAPTGHRSTSRLTAAPDRLDPGLVLAGPGVDPDRVALVDEDRDLTTRPDSVVAGLRAPVWVSPAKPGSVSVTTRSTVTGSSTPIVSPW